MDQTTERPLRVLIVDDHLVLRDGIVSLFHSQPDFQVVGVASSIAETLQAVSRQRPDLILMDVSLPDGTGPEATRSILASYPGISVVFLTTRVEEAHLFAAIRSGAKGFLLKDIPAEEMLRKLRGLKHGEAPLSGRLASRLIAEFAKTAPGAASVSRIFLLTPRELEVLRHVARGASNKEVGQRLHISVHTVRNHMHNILEKLGVHSRREAVRMLADDGRR